MTPFVLVRLLGRRCRSARRASVMLLRQRRERGGAVEPMTATVFFQISHARSWQEPNDETPQRRQQASPVAQGQQKNAHTFEQAIIAHV